MLYSYIITSSSKVPGKLGLKSFFTYRHFKEMIFLCVYFLAFIQNVCGFFCLVVFCQIALKCLIWLIQYTREDHLNNCPGHSFLKAFYH